MKLVKTLAAVGAAMLIVPVAGMAQQPTEAPQVQAPGARGQGGRGGRAAVAAPRQNPILTEQQHDQLRAFDEQQRTAMETARREIGDLHRQLEEELTAAQPNNGRVTQLRNSIVQKETAIAQQRLDRLAKLSSILTAEQRQQLRGRGLTSVLRGGGPGGVGRGGFRGPAMGGRGQFGPGAPGGRVMVQRPRGEQRRMQMPRGPRGGGQGMRQGFGEGPGGDAALRERVRRLEAELDALRRRIGR